MKPLVGISCCTKVFGAHNLRNHAASDACVRAASEIAGAIPVLLPAIGEATDVDALLNRLDGILLTGSRSNVHPGLYGGPAPEAGTLEDPARDATTLPLIRAAIERGIPVLAICRGFQELNVAFGGTLHPRLADLPGRIRHHVFDAEPGVMRVEKAHGVALTPGGVLHRLAEGLSIQVNSLHNQGVDRLAAGLVVEAAAEDGTIEAVRTVGTAGFGLGVQWHPEFDFRSDAVSRRIFMAFGEALGVQSRGLQLAAD